MLKKIINLFLKFFLGGGLINRKMVIILEPCVRRFGIFLSSGLFGLFLKCCGVTILFSWWFINEIFYLGSPRKKIPGQYRSVIVCFWKKKHRSAQYCLMLWGIRSLPSSLVSLELRPWLLFTNPIGWSHIGWPIFSCYATWRIPLEKQCPKKKFQKGMLKKKTTILIWYPQNNSSNFIKKKK